MTSKKTKHAEADVEARAAEPTAAFPFTASINEPQTVSLPLPPNVEVPVPAITSLTPTSCTIGDPDFTLYVSGENFFRDSVIHFANQDEPTTLEPDGTLSTGINMAVWLGPDTVQVQVKNGSKVSEPVDFVFGPVSRAGRK